MMCPGQAVYIVCGIRIEKAAFLRFMNGRCLVTSGSGGITVSRSRVFLTEDEARDHLPAASLARMRQAQSEARQRAQAWRYNSIGEPGDGWAGR